ncbi:helix-turn-helix transcriptional regulator [Candidatus Methylomicrobium oryzae]|jgi:DeoR family suf operon transcriptional repressor|uniref:helix-turn-helix transcriptional regulator n=1 Tax=Candidatus Methylomicrobium oryzae TaxID=2802053 RepID=UPI001923F8C4|nr:HTH domain-containing protein [Methylomicrobium sp. RS1]MBL1264871.1 HTH domain-containing protein [Methylomicrobium sp. RS1]
MAESISSRQHQILDLLLNTKAGLSIDELAAQLAISRNAVQQHIDKLERDGYVKTGMLNKTAGRPVRVFVLTEAGINSFQKQYAWFSELLLSKLRQEMGVVALERYLHDLAESLAQGLLPQFAGKQGDERLAELIKIMNALGFKARLNTSREEPASIDAFNCIYHDLAQKFQEVCEFDRALITKLLEQDIEHLECMAKGGGVCKFRAKPSDTPNP